LGFCLTVLAIGNPVLEFDETDPVDVEAMNELMGTAHQMDSFYSAMKRSPSVGIGLAEFVAGRQQGGPGRKYHFMGVRSAP